jgi:putative ABC transport system ATP-binding protein
MIRLENIQRRYVSDEVETTALADINLHVAAGEFVAIMGPSGCGKSTLLNTLGTVDRPTAGRYLFGERDLATLDEAELARFRAMTLGFVFQSFNLIDELTIEENVELGLVYRRDGVAIARPALPPRWTASAYRTAHATIRTSFPAGSSSAAIARAIVGEPKLILADEPTGNLDTENGQQVMDILTSLNADGATIIMVTHSPSHADIARRRIDMLDGRIVASLARAI